MTVPDDDLQWAALCLAWFHASGLYGYARKNGRHTVTCPWTHEHPSQPIAVLCCTKGEWPAFECRHCEGRDIKHVIALVQIDAA